MIQAVCGPMAILLRVPIYQDQRRRRRRNRSPHDRYLGLEFGRAEGTQPVQVRPRPHATVAQGRRAHPAKHGSRDSQHRGTAADPRI